MVLHHGNYWQLGNAPHIADRTKSPLSYNPRELPIIYDEMTRGDFKWSYWVIRVRALSYYHRCKGRLIPSIGEKR